MSDRELICHQVQSQASEYLDGRLTEEVQAEVQAHLKTCRECVQSVNGLQRLIRRTQEYPLTEPHADLARRLRESLSNRRQETLADLGRKEPRRFARALPAFITLAAALVLYFSGFHVGRTQQPPAPVNEVAAEDQAVPLRTVAQSDPLLGVRQYVPDPERFLRAAYELTADVASLDKLDRKFRRPLLQAQLNHFDLERQAAQWRHAPTNAAVQELEPLVGFVNDVARSVAEDDSDDQQHRLVGLQQQALSRNLLDRLPLWLEVPKQEQGAKTPREFLLVVRNVAPTLSQTERYSLARLLSLKDSWVSGRHLEIVRYAHRIRLVQKQAHSEPLGTSVYFTLATGLSELGLPDMAQPFLVELPPDMQRSVRFILTISPTRTSDPQVLFEQVLLTPQKSGNKLRDPVHPKDSN